jgi:hypothetical protein
MINLDDSVMVAVYDTYLDMTFNSGEVVRLCRCTAEKFPELFAIQLGGTPDQITLGEPVISPASPQYALAGYPF